MSCIGKNIKKIRTVKKISQVDFADLFGLARASVGSYEEGRAEPKIDTIIAIANHFGISIDLLLKKELTVNELYRFDIFKPELHQSALAEPPAPLMAPIANGIALVNEENVGEYVLKKGADSFAENLPRIVLPFLPMSEYRAFEVLEGSERFAVGDIVVGKKIASKQKDLQAKYLVLLTPTHLRILQSHEKTTIAEEVVEQWEITHTIAALNAQSLSLEERVERLERLVEGAKGK